jgi:membrane protein
VKESDRNKNALTVEEHLNKQNLIKLGFHIWRQFDDTYYTGFAAQIAYFFFMASIPTIVVLSQLLGIFDISIDFIQEWLQQHLDENMSGFVLGLFSVSSVRLTNVLMIILALWAASSLEFALARLSSYTLYEGNYRFNFWTERLKAIPTAIVSIISIAFSLAIFVYGDNLFSRFIEHEMLAKILVALKYPIAAGLFFSMILLNYYILPRIRVPLVAILPGAVVASLGTMIVTIIYAVYIGYIVHYDILYGSFANIIALMLWFYLISWVLCIGMMFNKAWDDVMKRGRLTQEMIIGYLEKQLGDSTDDYKKFIIIKEDPHSMDYETLAEKMSKQFVEGYKEENDIERRERMARWIDRDDDD